MLALAQQTSGGLTDNWILLVFPLWFVVSTIVGFMIGKSRGRSALGAVLGFFLGWVGWIIAAVVPRSAEVEARRNAAITQAMGTLQPQPG